ncbi:MAG: thiamine phosphate synthase [Candidatus Sulfotelmatobacter sp.]|jgi:thiamine-phosphate pyrophosphorylase
MPERCLLYYITDRSAFHANESTRRRCLLDKIAEAAASGVDYIQLREKDMSTRELEALAREASRIIGDASEGHQPETALLINSRTDLARAVGASGVHLPANDVSPQDVLRTWELAAPRGQAELDYEGSRRIPQISVSCHSAHEVAQAAAAGATLALFAPVFEKKDAPEALTQGLSSFEQAARVKIPVLALGGITMQNAESCLRAGAAGVAAIRLFQENEIAAVVGVLRNLRAV